ncbi:MAG TPA: hypothetical protein DDZ80_19265 [Cyanobacteria bacterium UBA8803]|nr:hypothetical protein [Cyanobacteria bacterium UBA9273]HBL60513.1 hypothetical protein [Cyanobacteria bacterium UBA8803]
MSSWNAYTVVSITLIISIRLLTTHIEQVVALPNLKQDVSKDNTQPAKFQGHERDITSAEFSPDGNRILTASRDGTAHLWDTSGNLIAVFQGHGTVTSAEFSPDGKQILTAHDRSVNLWDTSGNLIAELRGNQTEGERANTVEFSPNGKQIITTWVDTIYLWDTSGNRLAEFQTHKEGINSAIFSPDSNQILTASDDKTARLWDTSGNLLSVFQGHEGSVISAEFSPNGNQILTTSEDKTARLWDSSGKLLTVFQGYDNGVTSAEFSPDGNQILTASLYGTTARLWDTSGKILIEIRGHQFGVTSAKFSPDGRRILTLGDSTPLLWDISGNLLAEFQGHDDSINIGIFSPDGNQILTSSWGGSIRLWEVSAAIYAYVPKQTLQEGVQLNQQQTIESRQLALQKLEEALNLYRTDNNSAKAAHTLLLMGNIHTNLGQFQTALDSYNQALPLSRQAGAKAEEAAILNSLGQLYNDLADPKTALEYHNQALPLLYELNDRGGAATTLKNIGDIEAATGQWKNAIDSYNKALIISRSAGDLATEATALSGIGSIYIASKDWSTALNAYNQSLQIYRYLKDQIKETTILNQIGKIYADSGQISQAQAYYNQALPLSKKLGYKTEEARILYNQAILNRQQNNLAAAQAEIETAIKIIESLRTQIGSQELRQSYFAQNQDYYQFYIDLLMELHKEKPNLGYDGQALEISERARARSLLEILTEAYADIRQGVDPQLLEQEQTLQQQLNDLDHRKYELTSGQYSETELTEIKQKIDNVITQLDQLQAQIRLTSPRYANLKYPQPLTLTEIQQQVLDDDTILLEYALGEDRSYLWAVTKNSINSYVLPKRSQIEATAQTLRQSLTSSAAHLETGIPLSQILLTPIASQIGNKRLLIVGDGVLQYIPFAALPLPSSPTTPLLVQNEIVTLPSASTIAIQRQQLQNRTPAAKTLAVLADPVFNLNDSRFESNSRQETPKTPDNEALNRAARNLGIGENATLFSRLKFTRTEAEKILALVPEIQELEALDFNASRTQATDPNLAQYQIVHFATHGLLDSVNPELSGIVLSLFNEKRETQDGFLRLHDIFNLNLPAELVVLSACQTGLGENVKGEGIIGLTRGFMYAGAKRVVVSLWSVNDIATSELMSKFYQNMLQSGQNPVTALREAQLEMWNSGQWQSPYYWAAFTVQGDWR